MLLIRLAAVGLLNPVLAGGAMAISSVSVVSNSLRLARFRRTRGTGTRAAIAASAMTEITWRKVDLGEGTTAALVKVDTRGEMPHAPTGSPASNGTGPTRSIALDAPAHPTASGQPVTSVVDVRTDGGD